MDLSEHRRITAVSVHKVKGLQHLDVVEGLPQGVRARNLLEARSCEKLKRSKAFENVEGHRKFVVQEDKSREEFLVFLRRNHQGKEIDGQKFVERICEILPSR